MFTLLKNVVEKKDDYREAYHHFIARNSTPEFKAYLEKSDIIPNQNTELLQPDGKRISLDTLLARHKGKVILLDFWASWCSPCKYQMPFSKKLKKDFDKEKVEFIYLSVDHQLSSWEASNEDLNLSPSYLVINNYSSPLASTLNINAIPRYILIDKKGKIFNRDAPKPDDPKLKALIEKLLRG